MFGANTAAERRGNEGRTYASLVSACDRAHRSARCPVSLPLSCGKNPPGMSQRPTRSEALCGRQKTCAHTRSSLRLTRRTTESGRVQRRRTRHSRRRPERPHRIRIGFLAPSMIIPIRYAERDAKRRSNGHRRSERLRGLWRQAFRIVTITTTTTGKTAAPTWRHLEQTRRSGEPLQGWPTTKKSGPCSAHQRRIHAHRASLKLKDGNSMVNSAATDPTIPETIIPWYHTRLQDDRVQGYTLARHHLHRIRFEARRAAAD